jgi:hypothetical protein
MEYVDQVMKGSKCLVLSITYGFVHITAIETFLDI